MAPPPGGLGQLGAEPMIILLPPPPPPPPPERPDVVQHLEVDIVVAACTLCLALLLMQLLHWRPSGLLTHSGLCMLVGMGLNFSVWTVSSSMSQPQTISLVVSSSMHEIVYFVLIPPIIFEAGFSMRKRGFFDNLVPILLYAVVGTLISTFTAGAMLFGLAKGGVLSPDFTVGHCLLFAALISPTDPVATLSVLREVAGAPAMLRNCIFGEATLNDALSIVIFNVLSANFFALREDLADLVAADIARELLVSMGGSFLVGTACGLGAALATRRISMLGVEAYAAAAAKAAADTPGASWPASPESMYDRQQQRQQRQEQQQQRTPHPPHPPSWPDAPASAEVPSRAEVPHAELSLILTSAILTFSASERLGFSGIAALFAFGVLTRHYTFHNLSSQAQSASTTLFLTLATLCETSLSTLLGVAAFDYVVWFGVDREADSMLYTNGGAHSLAVVTLPVLFIARACNIFPLTALANCLRRGRGRGGRKQRISWQMQVVMWFSGMRGALSFALVVTLSERRSPHLTLPLPIYHQLVSATLVTIVVTTLLMAPATRPLVRSLRLGVDGTTEQGKELAAALLTGTGGDEGEGYGGGGGGDRVGAVGEKGSRRGGRHRGGRGGGVEAAAPSPIQPLGRFTSSWSPDPPRSAA